MIFVKKFGGKVGQLKRHWRKWDLIIKYVYFNPDKIVNKVVYFSTSAFSLEIKQFP